MHGAKALRDGIRVNIHKYEIPSARKMIHAFPMHESGKNRLVRIRINLRKLERKGKPCGQIFMTSDRMQPFAIVFVILYCNFIFFPIQKMKENTIV